MAGSDGVMGTGKVIGGEYNNRERVTASGSAEKVKALDAGADDFVTKPLDGAELMARVRSLLRIKRYHDLVTEQAEALTAWSATLESRVAEQVSELQRLAETPGAGRRPDLRTVISVP